MSDRLTADFAGTIILTEGSGDADLIIKLLENIFSLAAKVTISHNRYKVEIDERFFTIVTHNGYSKSKGARYDQKYEDTVKRIYKRVKDNDVIDAILVIVDADDDFDSRTKDIQKFINENIVQQPQDYVHGKKHNVQTMQNTLKIQTGYFILPNNKDRGSLETLVLKAIRKSDVLTNCVENLLACLSDNKYISSLTSNNKDKLKLRLYLNSLITNYKLQYKDVYQGEIDFNHKCFDELKSFLN